MHEHALQLEDINFKHKFNKNTEKSRYLNCWLCYFKIFLKCFFQNLAYTLTQCLPSLFPTSPSTRSSEYQMRNSWPLTKKLGYAKFVKTKYWEVFASHPGTLNRAKGSQIFAGKITLLFLSVIIVATLVSQPQNVVLSGEVISHDKSPEICWSLIPFKRPSLVSLNKA